MNRASCAYLLPHTAQRSLRIGARKVREEGVKPLREGGYEVLVPRSNQHCVRSWR